MATVTNAPAPRVPAADGPPSAATRLESVDVLRGAVMVVMALDHIRAFLGAHVDPENVTTTTPALFLTRWVTHFCAPVFVFLAGTGAFLRGQRGSRAELAWFLATRGLWLIVLEFTLVHWSWSFSFDYHFTVGQVIFAIGASMMVRFRPVAARQPGAPAGAGPGARRRADRGVRGAACHQRLR